MDASIYMFAHILVGKWVKKKTEETHNYALFESR